MMFLIILIKSLIIGGLVGVGVGAGAARMFHAPTSQGMGAFRTLGELNSCEGDPASHFSFGLGFFFNAWASSVAAGAFTQDVDHRIIPHWGAAALMIKNRNVAETLHNPKKMALMCTIIGMVVVTFLNTTASAVPEALQVTAVKVLVPAANLLVNIIMPVIFWLAAIDAGKRSGLWGTVFGGLAQLIMGNAVPGLVLGILIGKGVDDGGWNRVTKIMMAAIVVLFVLSGFFRGFDMKMLESFHLGVPNWLDLLHNSLSGK
ncbi:membrane protein [Salmonella enterica subsp. enterica serovar Choleraesuis]|nr:membrane protein [Salmonella enterica subsp. enterica serovar Choleraesuis]